jgi:hypothetical protein
MVLRGVKQMQLKRWDSADRPAIARKSVVSV